MTDLRSSPRMSQAGRGLERSIRSRYEAFCSGRSEAWPAVPKTLQAFINARSLHVGEGALTAAVRAIRREHLRRGWSDPLDVPLTRAIFENARKRCASREVKILRPTDIASIIDGLPDTDCGLRNKVMLLMEFCGRFTTSVLAGMKRCDVIIQEEGMRVHVGPPHENVITIKAYPADPRYCPVGLMRRYLGLLRDDEPALFRKSSWGKFLKKPLGRGGIGDVLRGAVRLLGGRDAGVRSLYVSAIVTATNRGASEYAIMRQLGFKQACSVRKWQKRYAAGTRDIVSKLGL